MKILHVLDSLDPRYGGPVRAVTDLSKRSAGLGLESELVGFAVGPLPADTPASGRSLPVAVPSCGPIQDHVFPVEGMYRKSAEFAGWLRENVRRFDGVVLHSMWLGWVWDAARVCREAGVPYAYFPHGMLEPWSVLGQGAAKAWKKRVYWWWRERRVYAGACAALFTTQREMRLAGETFRLPAVRREVVPYGVEVALADAEAPRFAELRDVPFVLFLGRVHPKKNPDLLIRAFGEAGVPAPWRLVVAGPASAAYRGELAALAASVVGEGRVLFVDFVEGAEKGWLLRNARWFALPSSQENFGVALLEALHAGCPAVVSDQVYLADELAGMGRVLPVRVEAWVAVFAERMRDEMYRETVVAMDRVTVAKRFDIEEVTRGWVETMERVFGG
jgi:glycosyltransferase involved in cell wall biosynthesis